MNIFNFLTLKKEVSFLDSDSTIRQALEKMDNHKYNIIPLINKEGDYIGTLSDGDLLRYVKNKCNFNISIAENTKILDIDRYRSYKELDISSSIEELMRLSMDQNFIPIVDDRKKFIGIVKRKTLLEYYSKKFKNSIENIK